MTTRTAQPEPETARPAVHELPEPVARFRALIADQPQIDTVEIETTAWMRRPGLPRIPLSITMAHRLGAAFVHDIRIGRGRLSFRFGIDTFIDGHGAVRIGPSVSRGPHYDHGALIAMWGEAIAFRSAWDGRSDVRWLAVDADSATLVVDGPEGDLPIRFGFDPETGLPATCSADRYKGDGPKVAWMGTTAGWRVMGGVLVPGRFSVRWADEPEPWLEITTRRVTMNAPVDDRLALGRRLLATPPPPAARRFTVLRRAGVALAALGAVSLVARSRRSGR
jgi:hypothetical protein